MLRSVRSAHWSGRSRTTQGWFGRRSYRNSNCRNEGSWHYSSTTKTSTIRPPVFTRSSPYSIKKEIPSSTSLPSKLLRRNKSSKKQIPSLPRRKKLADDNNRNLQKKKAKTLDDFFSNMGIGERHGQQKHSQHQQRHQKASHTNHERKGIPKVSSLSSSLPEETMLGKSQTKRVDSASSSSSSPAQKTDLASFFDQVDALVKERKRSKDRSRSSSPSLSSIYEKSTRICGGDENNKKQSILDIIAASKATAVHRQQQQVLERSPDAYDEDSFEEYLDILEPILNNPNFLRKHNKRKQVSDDDSTSIIEWLTCEEPVIKTALPTLEALYSTQEDDEQEPPQHLGDVATQQFQLELDDQRDRLMAHFEWTENQYDAAVGALLQVGNLCARNASAAPLDIAWLKLKEAGHLKNQKVLTNYLYVCATLSVQPMTASRKGGSILDFLYESREPTMSEENIDDGDNGESYNGENTSGSNINNDEVTATTIENGVDLACEIAMCHDLLFGPSEQSTSIRVRTLVSQGRAGEAEHMLDSNPTRDELRLRAYAPVFECYVSQDQIAQAFQLFVKMSKGKNVQMHSNLYVQLIAGVAENGYFSPNAEPIHGIKDLGYSTDHGPELFDKLASEMADVAIDLSSASVKRLYTAFQVGFEGTGEAYKLKRLHLLEPLDSCNVKADPKQLVASRVHLDESTGLCPRTGAQLRLLSLNAEQKQQLRKGLMYLSSTLYEERHLKKNSFARDQLFNFERWLQHRNGDPFTAIIDGPNVAYYMQNFAEGTFNYHQIKFVVDTLENMGEKALVILPERYTRDSFTLQSLASNGSNKARRQKLTRQDKQILNELLSSNKVYVVPQGCLDDYYWMYASVAGHRDMFIPPDNPHGRWPGIRPMLISNDKMRDHKLALLEPRLFRRWYSNFMVNFTFSAFVGEQCLDKEIGFRTADFYSREIQGNITLDEETREESGTAWHFPVSDWEANQSFCIRIPKATTSAD